VLAPDGFFVGHECDYGAFRSLRLSLAVAALDFCIEDQFSILFGAPRLAYSNLHRPMIVREISVG
jgi:hypothetical protein